MTVDDKIFEGLSSDPHLASYELLQRLEKTLVKGSPTASQYTEACGILEAFYDAQGWKVPSQLSPSGYQGTDPIEGTASLLRARPRLQYEAFVGQIMQNYRHVTKTKATATLNAQLAGAPGYATLEPEEKAELHGHLERIRGIVEASSLDDRKKNSLFERINELAKEIDRNGTRTDRFFAFAGELSFYVGQFAKNAKPAIEEAKSILRIIWRARERSDGTKLPRPDDVLLLPEPEQSPEA
jgi:hypothetical protein